MAEERIEPREINFRQWLPWTLLFRGFWVAVDYKKLLLAAAGILVMSLGWYFLAVIFYNSRTAPDFATGNYSEWSTFQEARRHWNLLHACVNLRQNYLSHTSHHFVECILNRLCHYFVHTNQAHHCSL